MIAKTIKFEDFDGNEVEEVHYFHLSKKELLDMEGVADGSLVKRLEAVSTSMNGAQIIQTFSWLIGLSYGQRVDGSASKFFKSDKIRDDFLGGLAYDALLGELMSNPGTAAEFVNGIFPKDLAKLVAQSESAPKLPEGTHEEDEASGLKSPRDNNGSLLPWAFRDPNTKEQTEMTREQLIDVMRRKSSGWKAPA